MHKRSNADFCSLLVFIPLFLHVLRYSFITLTYTPNPLKRLHFPSTTGVTFVCPYTYVLYRRIPYCCSSKSADVISPLHRLSTKKDFFIPIGANQLHLHYQLGRVMPSHPPTPNLSVFKFFSNSFKFKLTVTPRENN